MAESVSGKKPVIAWDNLPARSPIIVIAIVWLFANEWQLFNYTIVPYLLAALSLALILITDWARKREQELTIDEMIDRRVKDLLEDNEEFRRAIRQVLIGGGR